MGVMDGSKWRRSELREIKWGCELIAAVSDSIFRRFGVLVLARFSSLLAERRRVAPVDIIASLPTLSDSKRVQPVEGG